MSLIASRVGSPIVSPVMGSNVDMMLDNVWIYDQTGPVLRISDRPDCTVSCGVDGYIRIDFATALDDDKYLSFLGGDTQYSIYRDSSAIGYRFVLAHSMHITVSGSWENNAVVLHTPVKNYITNTSALVTVNGFTSSVSGGVTTYTEDLSTGKHQAYSVLAFSAGTKIYMSAWLKSSSTRYMLMGGNWDTGWNVCAFDLSRGTLLGSCLRRSISDAGDSYRNVKVDLIEVPDTTGRAYLVRSSLNLSIENYPGDGASQVMLRGIMVSTVRGGRAIPTFGSSVTETGYTLDIANRVISLKRQLEPEAVLLANGVECAKVDEYNWRF